MKREWYEKYFGGGPEGAVVSIALLFVFIWFDGMLDQVPVIGPSDILKGMAAILVIPGLGLHLWSLVALRTWWRENQLCTQGPFRYFRHPMYAAWVSFIALGVALYLNSWVYIVWYLLLQAVWPKFVQREEKTMLETFGDEYRRYAAHTGRFLPRLFRTGMSSQSR